MSLVMGTFIYLNYCCRFFLYLHSVVIASYEGQEITKQTFRWFIYRHSVLLRQVSHQNVII